jgi:glycosyltransferase involved in cell wall biosynthesis
MNKNSSHGTLMEKKIPISVCIITKNEEEKLPKCLESVKWASEVIVVDDFSSDRTYKICESYKNARFFQNEFTGFGFQKNYAVSKAKSEWILNIDADEEVNDTLREEILRAIQLDTNFAAYSIRRKNLWFGKYYIDSYPGVIRLFKKINNKFSKTFVHEKLITEGRVGKLQNFIIHKPKSHEKFIYHYQTYVIKYGKLAAKDYFKRGVRINVINAVWKLIFLPYLIFIREYFLKRRIKLGKTGFYISFCSSLCYYYAYFYLIKLQRN